MCYRCEVCSGLVPPKVDRKTFIVSRTVPCSRAVADGKYALGTREEVAAELAVCGVCHALLSGGLALSVLRERAQKTLEARRVKEAAEATPRKPSPSSAPPVKACWRCAGRRFVSDEEGANAPCPLCNKQPTPPPSAGVPLGAGGRMMGKMRARAGGLGVTKPV